MVGKLLFDIDGLRDGGLTDRGAAAIRGGHHGAGVGGTFSRRLDARNGASGGAVEAGDG